MSTTNIYILKLKNNKYYIGKTNDVNKRFQQHVSGTGSSWTSTHEPIKILKVIENASQFDEDKYVKEYMNKYGIDNVRGGRYCRITLDDNEIKNIKSSIISATDKCFKCGESGHFAKQCVNNSKLNIINDTLEIKYLEHDININKVQKKGSLKQGQYRIIIIGELISNILHHDGTIEDSYKKACDYIIITMKELENKFNIEFNGGVNEIKYLGYEVNINKVQKKGGPKEGHYRIKITNNSHTKTLYHDGGIEDSYKMACDYINTELNKCIVEDKLECQRCGRDGHLADTCYAKNHINADIGQHIDTEEELNTCYRCGRDGHWTNTCYAKRHVNGYYIKE